MPTFNAENAQIWKDLSNIDYFTQFIKAWLAFNAWLRNAYPNIKRDRELIDNIKERTNPVRNRIRSLLNDTGNNGQEFRGLIGSLHSELEKTYLEVNRNGQIYRITFTDTKLPNFASEDTFPHSRANYSLKRITSGANKGQIEIKLTKQSDNSVMYENTQDAYNLEELRSHLPFQRLNVSRKQKIIESYEKIAPYLTVSWLAAPEETFIQMGAVRFKDNSIEELAATIIEIIYQMRCLLFHGELVPKRDFNLVYEPAYRIVKVFLEAI